MSAIANPSNPSNPANPPATGATPFASNEELLALLHSYAESLIDAYLQQRNGPTASGGRLDQLLLSARAQTSLNNPSGAANLPEQRWQELQSRSLATLEANLFLPWLHLLQLFKLSRVEQEILAFALLVEIEPRFAAILHALAAGSQTPDSMSAEGGTGLPLKGLACLLANGARSTEWQAAWLDDAGLRQWEMLVAVEGAAQPGLYRLNTMLLAYLQARAAPQLRLELPLPLFAAELELAQHLLDPQLLQQAQRIVKLVQEGAVAAGFVLQVQASDQSLARSLLAACCAEWGMGCALLDARQIQQCWLSVQKQRPVLLRRLRMLCRDALLCNRSLVLSNCQYLCAGEGEGRSDGGEDLLDDVLSLLLESQTCIGVLNAPARRISDAALRFEQHKVAMFTLRLPLPDAALRSRIWQQHAPAYGLELNSALVQQLVNSYQFSEEQIVLVLKEMEARALQSGEDGDRLAQILKDCCREQSQREVMTVAQEVKTAWSMDDIVLAAGTRRNLQEVLAYASQRHQVIEEWGFAAKNQNSRNLCVLFYGPSGTGKTMAASILANELNLGLYKIDLANVISKYIGETEKHLAQLFDQAEAMNIVLFFDEAESLFSKRTETRDAHDRYANLQTGYLLQRIESYPGIVILSTNLLGNIDKAFTRRFKFMIEYPFPDQAQRLQLWRNAFPANAPLAADLDFELLAARAPLSGGSINNIALGAAFLAASAGRALSFDDVLQATEREYGKLGKVFQAADFAWHDED